MSSVDDGQVRSPAFTISGVFHDVIFFRSLDLPERLAGLQIQGGNK